MTMVAFAWSAATRAGAQAPTSRLITAKMMTTACARAKGVDPTNPPKGSEKLDWQTLQTFCSTDMYVDTLSSYVVPTDTVVRAATNLQASPGEEPGFTSGTAHDMLLFDQGTAHVAATQAIPLTFASGTLAATEFIYSQAKDELTDAVIQKFAAALCSDTANKVTVIIPTVLPKTCALLTTASSTTLMGAGLTMPSFGAVQGTLRQDVVQLPNVLLDTAQAFAVTKYAGVGVPGNPDTSSLRRHQRVIAQRVLAAVGSAHFGWTYSQRHDFNSAALDGLTVLEQMVDAMLPFASSGNASVNWGTFGGARDLLAAFAATAIVSDGLTSKQVTDTNTIGFALRAVLVNAWVGTSSAAAPASSALTSALHASWSGNTVSFGVQSATQETADASRSNAAKKVAQLKAARETAAQLAKDAKPQEGIDATATLTAQKQSQLAAAVSQISLLEDTVRRANSQAASAALLVSAEKAARANWRAQFLRAIPQVVSVITQTETVISKANGDHAKLAAAYADGVVDFISALTPFFAPATPDSTFKALTQLVQRVAQYPTWQHGQQYAVLVGDVVALIANLADGDSSFANLSLPPAVGRVLFFAVDASQAKDADGFTAALKQYAAPGNAYLRKRNTGGWTVNAYVGFAAGAESEQMPRPPGRIAGSYALSMPLGVERDWSHGGWSQGVFLQLFDLGQVASWRINNDPQIQSTPPGLTISTVFSPGLGFVNNIKGLPLSAGAILAFAPAYRNLTVPTSDQQRVSAIRLNAFFAVDVPLFP